MTFNVNFASIISLLILCLHLSIPVSSRHLAPLVHRTATPASLTEDEIFVRMEGRPRRPVRPRRPRRHHRGSGPKPPSEGRSMKNADEKSEETDNSNRRSPDTSGKATVVVEDLEIPSGNEFDEGEVDETVSEEEFSDAPSANVSDDNSMSSEATLIPSPEAQEGGVALPPPGVPEGPFSAAPEAEPQPAQAPCTNFFLGRIGLESANFASFCRNQCTNASGQQCVRRRPAATLATCSSQANLGFGCAPSCCFWTRCYNLYQPSSALGAQFWRSTVLNRRC